ncbi:hypothetical protein ACQEU3_38075 [Spirillospora sp. CA-253888]
MRARRLSVDGAPHLAGFRLIAEGSGCCPASSAPRSPTGAMPCGCCQRDALFTDRLAREVRRLGLHGVRVDPALTEEDLVREVSGRFGLAS